MEPCPICGRTDKPHCKPGAEADACGRHVMLDQFGGGTMPIASGTMQGNDDAAWRRDAEANGWVLPTPQVWPLRLPIVRWFRATYHTVRVNYFAGTWASAGVGFGPPNQRDLWVIYAISRGWC